MSTFRPIALLAVLVRLPALSGAEAERAPAQPNPVPPAASVDAAPAVSKPPEPSPAKVKTKLLPSALATVPHAAVPLTPRFQQIRDRVEVLFHDRIETPPAPDPRFNPFRPPGAMIIPVADVSASREGAPPATDLLILQQAVATLKVRGTVERGGHFQLVINYGPNKDGTYKEGDVLTLIVQDQPVHLRVRQVTRYSVMFSLRDAELALKF